MPLTPALRSRLLGILPHLLILGTAVVGVAVALWPSPAPRPLPPALARQVQTHAERTAVDTALVRRLDDHAQAMADSAAAQARRAAVAERHARRLAATADSLAAIAGSALTLADSAAAWQGAYVARTAERDTLVIALAHERQATASALARGDSLRVAVQIETERAWRADSLVKAVIAEATKPECRVLRVLGCPSRTQMLGAGVVAGVVTGVVLGGRVAR